MKLTVLGGGGVRAPMLAKSIANRARALGIRRVVFMDDCEEKLRCYGALARHVARIIDPELQFELTSDPDDAVRDADYVITTMRVGGDEGRVHDERIPLSMGLLGQETTGAGGFAMAMRSIPAMLRACERVRALARPGALVFNFTNPSGLVTQAAHDAGYDFVVGICDGPSEFIKEVERLLDAPGGSLDVDCMGLNHYSWYTSVRRDGRELLPEILARDDLFRDTEMRFFDPDLPRSLGVLMNGYLYYYYHPERAIANICRSEKTRGETIREINRAMLTELRDMDCDANFDAAMQIYLKYYYMRENSYMTIESGGPRGSKEQPKMEMDYRRTDNDGYAGVALNIIRAMRSGEGYRMVLSAPNGDSIPALRPEDIVEVTCTVDQRGIHPRKMAEPTGMIRAQLLLMKHYERTAARAILNRDRELAAQALALHPLIGSYSRAKTLVDEYLKAHAPYVGDWK